MPVHIFWHRVTKGVDSTQQPIHLKRLIKYSKIYPKHLCKTFGSKSLVMYPCGYLVIYNSWQAQLTTNMQAQVNYICPSCFLSSQLTPTLAFYPGSESNSFIQYYHDSVLLHNSRDFHIKICRTRAQLTWTWANPGVKSRDAIQECIEESYVTIWGSGS